MRTSSLVSLGVPLHWSGGETFSPSEIYFLGIVSPNLNAGLEIESEPIFRLNFKSQYLSEIPIYNEISCGVSARVQLEISLELCFAKLDFQMPDSPTIPTAEQRELELVQRSENYPLITSRLLSKQFRDLGVKEGMTLLVHSSLSSLGWVCGGAATVILALEEVLGGDGTLAMPTNSTDLSDPAGWNHPAVPEKWWQEIRDWTPAYSPDLTPTRQMGAISECFRKQDGTLRSGHPLVSFAARGKNARFITEDHSLSYSLGEGSPLARIYDLNGYVLLLGVGHGNNTSIHLAEYRANFPAKKQVRNGAPIAVNSNRQWVWFEDINFDDFDFEQVGADFSKEVEAEQTGTVGLATARLTSQRALVDFAVVWFEKNRK